MRPSEIVKQEFSTIIADVVSSASEMDITLRGGTLEFITESLMIAGILSPDRYGDWRILCRGCLMTLGKSAAASEQVFKCIYNFLYAETCCCDGCCCDDEEDEEDSDDQNDVVSEEQKKPEASMTLIMTNDGFECNSAFSEEPLDQAQMTLFLKIIKAVRSVLDSAKKPTTVADQEKSWEEELAESEKKFQELMANCGGCNPVPLVAGAVLAGDSEALKKFLSKHKDETAEKPKKKTTKKSK